MRRRDICVRHVCTSHTRSYTHTHTWSYIYIYIHIHTRTHDHTYTHIHIHTCTHDHTFIYIYIYTHAYMIIHIHIHTRTYILITVKLTSTIKYLPSVKGMHLITLWWVIVLLVEQILVNVIFSVGQLFTIFNSFNLYIFSYSNVRIKIIKYKLSAI